MYEMDQYTVSLLHFDDGIKDESGKVWTLGGGAVVSNSQKKYGSSSLFLDASKGSYISTPDSTDFDFQSGDFTFDFDVFFNNLPADVTTSKGVAGFFGKRHSYNANDSFNFEYTGYNKTLEYAQNGTTNGCESGSANWNPNVGQWYHVALVKKQNTIIFFVDGKKISSSTVTQPINHTSEILTVGALNNVGSPDYFFDGYIDEFRISNIARWIDDFDPDPVNQALLVVTMLDSSDREFQLSATEIDGFVNWYNHHASADTASYSLSKNIGVQGSKEYLSFEKIISFEVIQLTK